MSKNANNRVLLRGGLGNQLFQYAAGLSLSRRLGVPLELDISLLPKVQDVNSKIYSWPEQISHLNLGSEVRFIDSSNSKLFKFKTLYFQFARILGDIAPKIFLYSRSYSNNLKENPDLILQSKRPLVINSYCNSIEYFKDIVPEVRNHFQDINEPSDWFNSQLETISELRTTAIHIRLGDYTNLSNIYGNFSRDYFLSAMSLMEQIQGESRFLVFSDDPNEAETLIKDVHPNLTFVRPPENSRPIESLILMSKCDGLIASNSSFSWWAAFLGGKNLRVIFPRPMFASSGPPEPKSWLLQNWIQIGK